MAYSNRVIDDINEMLSGYTSNSGYLDFQHLSSLIREELFKLGYPKHIIEIFNKDEFKTESDGTINVDLSVKEMAMLREYNYEYSDKATERWQSEIEEGLYEYGGNDAREKNSKCN